MKYIGIVGSRRRTSGTDRRICREAFFTEYEPGDVIVSGGCPIGGDEFAETLAEHKGIPILIYHPKTSTPIPIRYFERNSQIAERCDILIALVSDDRTGGTEDTIRKATALGKRIVLV